MSKRRMLHIVVAYFVGVPGAGWVVAGVRPAKGTVFRGNVVVTATWIGPASGGNWSDAANWGTSEFPHNGNGGLTYNVVVDSPTFDPDVIHLDTDVEIEALLLRGTLEAQSVAANLIVNGLFEWQGSMLGPGTTTANGGVADPAFVNAVVTLGGGRILENAGSATFLTSLGITITDGAQLNNLAGGSIDLQTYVYTTNGGALNNFGLLFTGTCCPNTQGVFNNNGSVEVRAGGSLHVYSTGTHNGGFDVADGTALTFEPDAGGNVFTGTSHFSGLGHVELRDGVLPGERYDISGNLGLRGKLTANGITVDVTSAPTSPGFALEMKTSSLTPPLAIFHSGLPALNELILSSGTLHIVGDTTVLGPFRWDGTLSGPGTTTTQGQVRAVTGLTLDGRNVIANGGFRWQGYDFLLDNGAVFKNAVGSTMSVELSRRSRRITTNTPQSPGRFVNSGLVSQSQSAPAVVMTDWRQTATGVTNATALAFHGNTDISGAVIAPWSYSPLTFAGPDTGARITHRLKPDSTLTALRHVNVGDPNGAGSDVINAEFAGMVDFSDPGSQLNIHGANTTLVLPFGAGGGVASANGPGLPGVTVNHVEVNDGTLAVGEGLIACCFEDYCWDTDFWECADPDYTNSPQPPGSRCDDDNVCPTSGACCHGNGTCDRILDDPSAVVACTLAGGDYLGNGTACDQCEPVACCLPHSSCDEMPRPSCLQAGGFPNQVPACTPGLCSEPDASIALRELIVRSGQVLLTPLPDPDADCLALEILDVGGACTMAGQGDSPCTVTADRLFTVWGSLPTVEQVLMEIRKSGEIGANTALHLNAGARLSADGEGQPAPMTFSISPDTKFASVDGTGTFLTRHVNLELGETLDPVKPVLDVQVPAELTDTTIKRRCAGCPGNTNTIWGDYALFGLEHVCSGVYVEVRGTYDDSGVERVKLEGGGLSVHADTSGVRVQSDALQLQGASFEAIDVAGSPIAGIEGDGSLQDLDPRDGIDLLYFGTEDRTVGLVWPGDLESGGTQPETGTLTLSGRNVVIDTGSVLTVDIDPLAAVQRNDLLEIVATTSTTFDASLEVSIASGSECSIAPTDAFTIVTGDAITYPGGGDGRRTLTLGGEGSFVVHQNPTGIVLDSFSLTDGDGNGTVDSADTQEFVGCLSGPGGARGGGCDAFDFNGDGHVDMIDFTAIQKQFGTVCP